MFLDDTELFYYKLFYFYILIINWNYNRNFKNIARFMINVCTYKYKHNFYYQDNNKTMFKERRAK